PAVLDEFSLIFRPCGFRREAFSPAYGLAESTLAGTANPIGAVPGLRTFDVAALERGQARLLRGGAEGGRVMPGSGEALPDVPIAIVDPQTLTRCAPHEVGEIWVGGPTIAEGYWQRPDATQETFGARIAGESDGGTYLRTGDLGV